jgi:hypothetical protein
MEGNWHRRRHSLHSLKNVLKVAEGTIERVSVAVNTRIRLLSNSNLAGILDM